MIWNDHSKQVPSGAHAIFGASKYSWLSYTSNDDVEKRLLSSWAPTVGTTLHELAAKSITHKLRLTKSDKKMVLLYLLDHGVPRYIVDLLPFDDVYENLALYVRDAIGYRMIPEQVLYYSENFFGTADAISFRDNTLRIHDLKTGSTKASLDQLAIYASLFCLEYKAKPGDISIQLCIYQNNEIITGEPTADIILPIMDKITSFDKYLSSLKEADDGR